MPNRPLARPLPDEISEQVSTLGEARWIRIRVLILEDSPEDAERMEYELRQSGFHPECRRVDTEQEYVAELAPLPDVILSDYGLPQFGGPQALKVLQGFGLDIPFIVVSGVLGEDAAVAMMRQGATDYLLKDRLRRLGPAVRRALGERQLRSEKKQADRVLMASEERFFSFMNNSPALAFIKDAAGRILYMNSICGQVWNMSLAQCEGKLGEELWPAGEAARQRKLDQAVLHSGRASRVVEELTLRDGAVRHLLSYRFPFEDAAGWRVLGGVSVDITEQMRTEQALARALAAKETLLKEVHHRVKNNLQIISSLLNMQAVLLTDIEQKRVFQESQQRVQSMAMIHERLCANEDIEHVDLREYVEALTRELFSAHGPDPARVGLRLALEAVSLNLDQAIPCGLILNELVSNALKYAFPADRRGEISVSLSSDKSQRVTLRIADNGVGMPPDANRGPTLGMSIVNVLTRQLGGTLGRDDSHGVDISLAFHKAAEPFMMPLPTKKSRMAV